MTAHHAAVQTDATPDFAPVFDIERCAPPPNPTGPIDALLEAIYQSVLKPDHFWRLQHQLLAHFREDRSRDDTPLTRVILGHIKRALRLGALHAAMQGERQRVLEVIDAMAPPVLVIDEQRRVLGMNLDAEVLMRRQSAFVIDNGVLQCRVPDLLTALIAQADDQSHGSARLGGAASSASAHGLVAYIYTNKTSAHPNGPITYSLLLIDPQCGIRHSIEQLGRRTGLTPREAELIELGLQGFDLDAICDRARITLHTLRQHIKNIYAKTGVHNQNALFALVLRNVVLTQASSSGNAKLLPHITGLAHSRLLRLPGGRQLSYAEYGAPHGMPVLYFHSLNASRLELLLHADRLCELGVRLISMDRPGIGLSEFTERRDYREYTDDVLALLDELRLDSVHLLSASAGSAHALHTAWALPHRVRSVHCTAVVPPIHHILASDSPSTLNSMLNSFFRVVPSLLRPAMELAMYGQTVESLLTAMTVNSGNNPFSLTATDIAYITAPEHLPYFVTSMMESLRQGPIAWAMESGLINQPWSIDAAEIRVPVHLWHGTQDGLVPQDMVAAFANTLPNATLTVLPDTHLMVFHQLDALVRRMRGTDAA
ncbi:MAG: hypothetical protein RLZZ618_105 [Pseudomonadota bacterium]|jgi:pimeloyl-ACP methyl ester carboxylesterase/DNA-binding CsgD family transcriptional regulator